MDQEFDTENGGDGKGEKGDSEENLQEDAILDDDLGKKDNY